MILHYLWIRTHISSPGIQSPLQFSSYLTSPIFLHDALKVTTISNLSGIIRVPPFVFHPCLSMLKIVSLPPVSFPMLIEVLLNLQTQISLPFTQSSKAEWLPISTQHTSLSLANPLKGLLN